MTIDSETQNLIDSEASAELSFDEIELIAAPTFKPVIEASDELLGDMSAIPDKMAFKIGEAADMVGVKQYVLRYWESEFDILRPRKSKNNQRVYSRRDVETAMMIKKLLYQDRFSIEGARAALRQLKANVKEEKSTKAVAMAQDVAVAKLRGLVGEIQRVRSLFN
jgi:DNA-binding transcriptional MerR regulator